PRTHALQFTLKDTDPGDIMHSTSRNDHIFSFMAGWLTLLFLFTACSSNATPVTRHTPPTPGITSPVTRGFTPSGTATVTLAMPPTQTTCPQAGMARAMIMAPLLSGSHQNIIYTFNRGTY